MVSRVWSSSILDIVQILSSYFVVAITGYFLDFQLVLFYKLSIIHSALPQCNINNEYEIQEHATTFPHEKYHCSNQTET